jgi:hypothetical protein
MKKLTLVAAGVLLLAGCASTPAESPTATPSVDADAGAAEAQLFCTRFGNGLQDYTAWVAGLATSNVDVAEWRTQQSYIDLLGADVPDELTGTYIDYAGPADEIARVVDAGGGAVSFPSTDYKAASVSLVSFCGDLD